MPLLVLYGLGVTLGAGIYVLVGATAAEAGIYAPISFLVAAIVVSFTALSYAELATRYPVSAGEAVYVGAGFGWKSLTLIVGLLVALSGIVSASAVSIGAANYLSNLVGLPVYILVMLTVLAMGLLAAWGIVESVSAAAVVTVLEIGGLLLVIGWGFVGASGSVLSVAELIPAFSGTHWLGIGTASVLAFFAFIGFEDMANVAEEVKQPRRTYPRAVLLTLVITTLLYLLTTVAVVTTVPINSLAGSPAPLALAFASAPQSLTDAFVVIAVVATVNGILIQMVMASRVIFGLADRGHLPRQLAKISPRTRTPLFATALVVGLILLLSQAFPIALLAERTSQIVLVTFILVNLALIRIKRREERRPPEYFRVPTFVPVAGVVTSLGMLMTAVL